MQLTGHILAGIPLASSLFIIALLAAGQSAKCEGRYRDGSKPTEGEIANIRKSHAEWLSVYEKQLYLPEALNDPRRANLCGADLSGVDLSGADLRWALLSGATLINAQLGEAKLQNADLSWAVLNNAVMICAKLNNANLIGASLWGGSLDKVDLTQADLTQADLTQAILRDADMSFTIFESKPESLPIIEGIALAKNLPQMTYKELPIALVRLRDEFKKAGLRQQEREVTFAIKRREREKAWEEGRRLESLLNFILFEHTSGYELLPFRPLQGLLGLILMFSFLYWIALKKANDCAGISVISTEQEITLSPVWISFYFSLLSAFHIGWRDLAISDWIIRLQRREYTLRPRGWVRCVSGVQSLLSVGLLALWLLTYFGRLFE